MYVPVGEHLNVVRGQLGADLQVRKAQRRVLGVEDVQLRGGCVGGRHELEGNDAGNDGAGNGCQNNVLGLFQKAVHQFHQVDFHLLWFVADDCSIPVGFAFL